ncbi:hypothetical protein VPH35_016315 [Triticum aestivum]
MKTLGQSGDEDPAPRRRPKLSAATAAKADQIEDLVVNLLLLGTIQREVTKRKNFRSNPAAQVGEGTPMATARSWAAAQGASVEVLRVSSATTQVVSCTGGWVLQHAETLSGC